jgi:ribosomal protein S18 acetylase RimI-like enzyme
MSETAPVSLDAIPIKLNSPEYQQDICGWPYPDSYVGEMLQSEIPDRVSTGKGRVWAYRDSNREIVGFGTMDICSDYSYLTDDVRPHTYIPLLAVNPQKQGNGFGTFIIRHLVDEATVTVSESGGDCHGFLFLDVYDWNTRAISLYEKHGFLKINTTPELDEKRNQSYFVMALDVSIAA